MLRQILFRVAAGLAAVSLALVACQPQTIIQTVAVPQTVAVVQPQVVSQTQIVEVTAQPGSWTRPHPILSDVRVRRALAHCTNKLELLAAVYPLLRACKRITPHFNNLSQVHSGRGLMV